MRSALVLLALLALTPGRSWQAASNPTYRVVDIMQWLRDHYDKDYAPNSREKIRRQTLHQFVDAGLVRYNPDDPNRPVNSGNNCYYGAKLAAERVISESGLPWTTLRATQFHDLSPLTAQQMAKLPVIPVPSGFRFQPVDTEDRGAPRTARARRAGRPRPRHGRAARVQDVRAPPRLPARGAQAPGDRAGAAARQGRPRVPGGREPGPDRAVGLRTWEGFLAERVG